MSKINTYSCELKVPVLIDADSLHQASLIAKNAAIEMADSARFRPRVMRSGRPTTFTLQTNPLDPTLNHPLSRARMFTASSAKTPEDIKRIEEWHRRACEDDPDGDVCAICEDDNDLFDDGGWFYSTINGREVATCTKCTIFFDSER